MKTFSILIALICLCGPAAAQDKNAAPYSAEQVTQTFTKTVHGGVLHVMAKAADNPVLIKAIQGHLFSLAGQFRNGDFSYSQKMHGADMPGLATLKSAKTDDIKYEYRQLANGGQIHFSSEYPQDVQALHEWFDAQTAAHGGGNADEHGRHHNNIAE